MRLLPRLDVDPDPAVKRRAPARAHWLRDRLVVIAPFAFALAAGLVVIIASSVQRTGPYGTFAGYNYLGAVDSVSASWTVPATLGGAADAAAATWIGVQSQTSAGRFVQVGTQEQGSGGDFAFWSDPQRHFTPQFLGSVEAGDRVHAVLERTPRGWLVEIDDPARHGRHSIAVPERAHANFDQAEWLEEDPTESSSGSPQQRVPYPQLAAVSFDGLRINGRPPSYPELYSQWMSLPGEKSLAPTPLLGDDFTISPASVSPVGARFLDDTARVDPAYSAALGEIGSSAGRETVALGALAGTLQRATRNLARQPWPAPVRRSVARVEAGERAVVADVHSLARAAPARRAAALAKLERDVQTQFLRADALQRSLGVPQYIP